MRNVKLMPCNKRHETILAQLLSLCKKINANISLRRGQSGKGEELGWKRKGIRKNKRKKRKRERWGPKGKGDTAQEWEY